MILPISFEEIGQGAIMNTGDSASC